MAHELLIENGEAAMFYTGDKPWNGLGQRLDSPGTAAEAIRAARLDWEVTKVPLYIAGGNRLHELPGKHAVVEKFLLLSNSHDGESAVQVKFTPIRVVCHNTLTQALARGFTHTVRHDRDLWGGLRDVQEALGFITREYDALAQAFKAFAVVRLDEEALAAYLASVFPGPKDVDDERAWERNDAWRHWSAWLFRHGKGNQEKGHRRHAVGGLQRRHRAGRPQRRPARRAQGGGERPPTARARLAGGRRAATPDTPRR